MSYCKSFYLLLAFLLFSLLAFGQSEVDKLLVDLKNAKADEEKSKILTQLTALELSEGDIESAEKYANDALALTNVEPSANLLSHVAKLYERKNQFATSLNYYLQALKEYEKAKDEPMLAQITEQIGSLYKNWGVNEKAVEYLAPAYQKYAWLKDEEAEKRVLTELVVTHQMLGEPAKSLKYNQVLLGIHKENGEIKKTINALSNISNLHIQLNQPDSALKDQLEILELDKSLGDSAGISSALNNLGFLYKRLKEPEKALKHFEQSLDYAKEQNPVTLVNIGVMHQVMGNFEPSLLSFFEAAKIREAEQNDVEVAKVCNYISAVYQTLDDTENALRYTERAIQFGKKAESNESLAVSYQALSNLYQSMWRNKKALEYYKLYAETKDAIQENNRRQLQNELQKRVEAEKKENDLKLLLVDKEVNQLSLTKLQLEAEKKEKELELQLQEKELANASLKQQELEKERYLQSLILERKELDADKRRRELAVLQANDSLQRLALKQNELEEAERKKSIELLKKENEIKDLLNKEQLAKQEAERTYFFYGLGAVILVALLLLVGFILKQRDNAKLAAQKKEIAEKNEELNSKNDLLNEQNDLLNNKNILLKEQKDEIMVQTEELSQQRDEILAQRDYIEEKNKELERQKSEIEKAYHNISVLSAIGQDITSTLDLSAIVETVYTHVNELMDATSFGIGVYNPDEDILEFTDFIEKNEVLPYSADSIKNSKLPSVKCFTQSEEIFINNLEDVYDVFSISTEENRGETPSSLIYIPLMVEERKVGVLTVQSFRNNAYTDSHLTLLRTLASYISIALDNSRAYRHVTSANKQIVEKNKQITDSLRYALTIEEAILPANDWFTAHFEDFFVLYKPKDIVSGDFYWAHEMDHCKIVAAIDCTGHGVPGAFMSMIGNSLFNQAVKEEGMDSPAAILEFVNDRIKRVFKQESSDTSEGMDICLCKIANPSSKGEIDITFAGAKRPLYVIDDSGEIKSLKSDRISIGWPYKKKQAGNLFHNQTITLQKGNQIYLTTDGYADNHGLEKSKIGSPRLRKLIQANQHKSMAEQQQILSDYLLAQQGSNEQRDDITVIGLKV